MPLRLLHLRRPPNMLNLLHYPLIIASYQDEHIRLSLPDTLHALAKNEVDDFIHLVPRQRQLWHEFLCRLAAIAMLHSSSEKLPESGDQWLTALTNLTKDKFPFHEPWELTTGDPSAPAFLQPAMHRETARRLSKPTSYPLPIHTTLGPKPPRVLAKHLATPDIDHWIYFLVEAQTAHLRHHQYPHLAPVSNQHYSHPTMAITPGTRPGPRFVRDTKILLDQYQDAHTDLALHWLHPWDGRTPHPFNREQVQTFPLAIRVNRIIRLIPTKDHTAFSEATTPQPKYRPTHHLNAINDPWSTIQPYSHTASRREHLLTLSRAARFTDAHTSVIPSMALYSRHNINIPDPTLVISISSISHRHRCQNQTMEIPITTKQAPLLGDQATHHQLIQEISAALADQARKDRKAQRSHTTDDLLQLIS